VCGGAAGSGIGWFRGPSADHDGRSLIKVRDTFRFWNKESRLSADFITAMVGGNYATTLPDQVSSRAVATLIRDPAGSTGRDLV